MMIEHHAPGCDRQHTPRQACNTHTARLASADERALPEHEGTPNEAMLVAEDERGVHDRRAVADGPLEVIDTTKLALLPFAAIGAAALLAFVVVARLVRRRAPTR